MTDTENLESMLNKGQDNALLRFALGSAFFKLKKYTKAAEHLARALEQDPDYSAAWKIYGKTLTKLDKQDKAINAYQQGIAVAEKKGDIQTAKEMSVFLKRLKHK